MSPRPTNINLDEDFPGRLRHFREGRTLSKSDLAAEADLSYRTILELESGKRSRVQEKTLMLLAKALGIAVGELLPSGAEPGATDPEAVVSPQPRPTSANPASRLRRVLRLALPVAATLVLLTSAFWFLQGANAVVNLDDGVLEVRDSALGISLWQLGPRPRVRQCLVAPWSNRVLLVGLRDRSDGPELFLALDRATGRELWGFEPDPTVFIAAFGDSALAGGFMRFIEFDVCDLEGDGRSEVVLHYNHSLYAPSCLCVVDSKGRLVSQYSTWGFVYDFAVFDIDNDGKDEIIATGTSNAPEMSGATVFILDDEYCRGAAVDSLTFPETTVPDSSRVRVVIPNYPTAFMSMMREDRLHANMIQYIGTKDGPSFSVEVGTSRWESRLVVFLDRDLHPVQSAIKDSFLELIERFWPDSLKTGTGPIDADWRAQWLASHRRFEAGHWPRPTGTTTTAVDSP